MHHHRLSVRDARVGEQGPLMQEEPSNRVSQRPAHDVSRPLNDQRSILIPNRLVSNKQMTTIVASMLLSTASITHAAGTGDYGGGL